MQAYVVVGGRSNGHYLSSTELLFPGAEQWKRGESLPKPLAGMASVSVPHNGLVYMLGIIQLVIMQCCQAQLQL